MQRRLRDKHPGQLAKSATMKFGTGRAWAGAESAEASYRDYVQEGLARLGLDPGHAEWPSAADLEKEWACAWEAERALCRLFYLMREALAPLVEALIVLDRALYMKEQLSRVAEAPTVRVIPVFDPQISPRNLALYASVA